MYRIGYPNPEQPTIDGIQSKVVYVVGTSFGAYNGSTTTFPFTYNPTYIDVFLNGTKLIKNEDYDASSGTEVVLTSAAPTGAYVDLVAYGKFQIADTFQKSQNLADADDVTAIRSNLGLIKQINSDDYSTNKILLSDTVATQEQTGNPEGVTRLIRADRQWEAPGWKVISQTEFSLDATSAVDFDIPNDFNYFEIDFHGVNVSIGEFLLFRISTSGTIHTTNYDRTALQINKSSGTITEASATDSSAAVICTSITSGTNISNATTMHGKITFASNSAIIYSYGGNTGASTGIVRISYHRRGIGSDTIDRVRFLSGSGSIFSGSFTLRGLRGA